MVTPRPLRQVVRLAILTIQAWIALAAFDLALTTGFAAVHERIRQCRTRQQRRGRPSVPEEIIWALDEACVWYVKRAACLQRSAVATWLLRRHGIDAELVIGYRPIPFESHAWVELNGRVLNDRPQYPNVFTVLDRL